MFLPTGRLLIYKTCNANNIGEDGHQYFPGAFLKYSDREVADLSDCEYTESHSRQGADGEARTRDRRVPANLRADSLATVPPTPPVGKGSNNNFIGLTETSPQQGDLRLSGPPPGQGTGGGARTRDRRVPADLRADSLALCQ
ncbi:hypothetical protein PoB_004455800 [Plakobranchus ocellatus]|uniref:Uncharacterized protein n=1 Tax=Plakobranchus ocellatus TaxID=259542 RepID=A0AAV4BEN8_9GAST|nr:hypothetical protein PoB_004455800 [Plakobranchus ocellatus]